MTQLILDKVHYRYQNEAFNFDLRAESGETVALLGPSGAGKSTLLALVAGFIEPLSGDIYAGTRRLNGLAPYQRPLAMLFQEHNLFAHLSLRDNIALGLHPGLKLSKEQWQQAEQAAELVGIGALLDRLPEEVSGGQKQRAALARCFVQSCSLWLLDEPFSALDPVIREEMLGLVKNLAREKQLSVVMVTHHLSDARAVADRFAFMADGRVKVSGSIEALSPDHSDPQLSAFVRAGG